MTPARGKLFVRPVETPESLPGGRIVLTEATRKDLTAQQAEVVAIGELGYCEDENCERTHFASIYVEFRPQRHRLRHHAQRLQPSDWVLLAPRCLVETDTPNLYCCAQDDVIARLEI